MSESEIMRVALDLEDVLVGNVELLVEELNRFLDENSDTDERFSAEDIEGWRFKGLREKFADIRGWEDDILDMFMNGDNSGWPGFLPLTEEIWREQPEKFREIEENTRAKVEKISDNLDEESEIYIVTARENVDDSLKEKINSLGLDNLVEGVIVKNKKDELDFDIYIDDYPYLHDKLEEGVQIMLNRSWNKDQSLKTPHTRVNNLEEAGEVIQDLG